MTNFGTIWRKLVRNTDPITSIEAAEKVDTTRMEQLVYETIGLFPDGAIQDDILDQLKGYPYSSVTGRFRALLDKGLITDTGLTRPGRSGRRQRVLKLTKGMNDA